jgi:hypothetical protein
MQVKWEEMFWTKEEETVEEVKIKKPRKKAIVEKKKCEEKRYQGEGKISRKQENHKVINGALTGLWLDPPKADCRII